MNGKQVRENRRMIAKGQNATVAATVKNLMANDGERVIKLAMVPMRKARFLSRVKYAMQIIRGMK